MTVARLAAEMDAYEFAQWRAYDLVEPIGEIRGDVRIAILTALLANAHRDTKRRREPYAAKDFLPFVVMAASAPAKDAAWSDADLHAYMQALAKRAA